MTGSAVGDRLSRGRQANGRTFDFRFLQGTQALEMHLLFFDPSSPLSFFPFRRPFGALVPTFSLWASGRTSLVSDFGSASITGSRNRMCVYEVVGSCWSLLRLSRSFAHLSFRGKRGMIGGGVGLIASDAATNLPISRKGNFAHDGYLGRPLVRALRAGAGILLLINQLNLPESLRRRIDLKSDHF
jgi:hypothetical protein